MTDHLTSITEAAARLREALTAISPAPAGDLLAAHCHVEEILLCVARHEENEAHKRSLATVRASHARLTHLRRLSLQAETCSPRFVAGAPVATQAAASPTSGGKVAGVVLPMPGVEVPRHA